MDFERIGCGTAIGALILIVLVIFGGPWVVMHAWTLIAVNMFGAPVMSYWTAFWGTLAMHIIFDLNVNVNRDHS